MKKIELYQFADVDGEIKMTTEPKSTTSAQLFYMLIADEGNYLYNKKTQDYRRSIVTPAYLSDNWVEQNKGRNVNYG